MCDLNSLKRVLRRDMLRPAGYDLVFGHYITPTRRMRPHGSLTIAIVLIKGNYVHNNGDAGMALMEVFNASVSNNTFEYNKYGARLSVGCADNVLSNNLISDSAK